MVKTWKCNVCGYLHEGAQPPDICPLCGAVREKFILLEKEKINLLPDLVASLRVHSVASHFPNGLVPTLHAALLVFLLTGEKCFETAALFMLALVLAVVPVSVASGLYDWKRHYAHIHANIFLKKILLAAALAVCASAALLLRVFQPGLWEASDPTLRRLYGCLLLAALALVVLLGHYGGKLVFEWRKQRP